MWRAAVVSAANAALYCPSSKDLTVAYTDPQYPSPVIRNQGWTIAGGGGVATQAAFNLLGGYVEFDIDIGGVKSGVNANVYAISPKTFQNGRFNKNSDYCDGAKNGSKFCLEVDWLEANGHCGGSMTIHAIEGPGNGCTAWGCRATYSFKSTKYHYRIEYSTNGKVKVERNGVVVPDLYPTPGDNIWNLVKQHNEQHGSVIYSSEWVGWVPREDCGKNGDLHSSGFTVSNLVIQGHLVKGPITAHCQAPPAPTRRRSETPRRRRSTDGCADDTHDCRSARCCKDTGKICYEKDASWASCRDIGSCKPGSLNPYDPPAARKPWTCYPITKNSPPAPPAPTRRRAAPSNCVDDSHDCRSAKCCKTQGKTCYEKDSGWASCRDTGSCSPGSINPYDPPDARKPWTCRPIRSLEDLEYSDLNTTVYELV